MNLRTLLSDTVAGHRLTPAEGRRLIDATGRDVLAIAAAADEVREERVGNRVTYVRNQNLHVTNVCKNVCGFCGFGKTEGRAGDLPLRQRRGPAQGAARGRPRRDRDLSALGGPPGLHGRLVRGPDRLDPRGRARRGHPHLLARGGLVRGRQGRSSDPRGAGTDARGRPRHPPGDRGRDPGRRGAGRDLPEEVRHGDLAPRDPRGPRHGDPLDRDHHVRRGRVGRGPRSPTSTCSAESRTRPAASPSSCP